MACKERDNQGKVKKILSRIGGNDYADEELISIEETLRSGGKEQASDPCLIQEYQNYFFLV
jgi:hypothetical protein